VHVPVDPPHGVDGRLGLGTTAEGRGAEEVGGALQATEGIRLAATPPISMAGRSAWIWRVIEPGAK
jgi:hypothetical protein